MMHWSRMGTPRRVIFVVVCVLALAEVASLILGTFSFLLVLLIGVLSVVNRVLWSRDEAYFSGLEADRSAEHAPDDSVF